MNTLVKILYLFLILSFTSCINAEYEDIETYTKTKFSVNKEKAAYFKYFLGEEKGPIGLEFLLAKLYTVQVSIYKSLEDDKPIQYFLAQEPFKEIDTSEFGEYIYIVIEETSSYFYEDYITIYNPKVKIELTPGEPLTINNFLSNNKYTISLSSANDILLLYNTLNEGNNTRKITISNGNETIIEKGEDSYYKLDLTPGEVEISVENFVQKEGEEVAPNQDFSLIFYEKTKAYGFSDLVKNTIKTTKYIHSDQVQTFYYYADISEDVLSNTINFKLFFKYYVYKNNTNFYTKIIYLNEEITDSDLEENIPTENELPFGYDVDSDEFLRIYFRDEKKDTKYKYLLVKVEIIEDQYYIGSHNMEVSIGDQVQVYDRTEDEYNKAKEINTKLNDYIPTYLQLKLDSNEMYLLTSQNQELTTYIIGDLLDDNNQINENYLINTNEIIILSNINELTIKLFGSTTKDINIIVEKINKDQLLFAENDRNNNIFEISMDEDECNNVGVKYVLGTFDYEKYAYGEITVNYYATADSGDFLVYFKDYAKIEDETLFPQRESTLQELNTRIVLNKNLDLFTVKCKKAGTMSIRPEYKTFDETTHIIEQNGIEQILLHDYSEMVQLTTSLGQNTGIVYFSILSLDKQTMNITSDTPGVFDNATISNEPFIGSANLSEYKMDQLAIKVKANSLDNNIEVTEIIHNKYNTYKKLEEGDNNNINEYNAYIQIKNTTQKVNLIIDKLKNKKISYGVIKTAINDENYLNVANNYTNTTEKEIKEDDEKIVVENIYKDNKDIIKPYLYLVISVLNKEDNINYNINVEIEKNKDDEDDDDEDNTTALIVVILLFVAILVGSITLAIFMLVIKKRNSANDDDNNNNEKLYTQNLNTQVDP